MKTSDTRACVFGGLLVACYGIYAFSNAGEPDGYIFGTVIAAVCAIGGYVVGSLKAAKE
jgi:hypothetical protein